MNWNSDLDLSCLPDDTFLYPVRASWRSVGPNASGRTLSLSTAFLARRMPSLLRIVDGAPASIGDLRERHESETGAWGSLESYVAQAATLACDRAERQLTGDRYKVPRRVAQQVATSTAFRAKVAELAHRIGRDPADVHSEAANCVAELATSLSPAAIDAYRTVLAPMHARAWNVQVDVDTLEPLRALNRRHALIFLPAHRSYVDPLVLGEVLHNHDFPRNHILGGNNMAIWPIGPLGKRAGVVFIRRANADDLVYKLALREYLAHLAAKRFNLEWYIEGGRTRTGKLRPPKLGLLSYLARALDAGRVDDVQLVPVSITYDHMHEVGALSDEQGGKAKTAEGTRWLVRYVTGQLRNTGNAWVRFGDPFSLRDALAVAGEGATRLDKVAFQICDGINRATPMTPTALVTYALLSAQDRARTLAEVRLVVEPLLSYLDARKLAGPHRELRSEQELVATLNRLVDVGVVTCFDKGSDPVWSIAPGQHRVAAFYRNGALHHLVTRAIVELSLLRAASTEPAEGESRLELAWREAARLRDLLKFEFFFPPTERFRTEVVAELSLIHPDWSTVARERGAAALLQEMPVRLAHGTLRTFLDAQLVVAHRLAQMSATPLKDEQDFISSCLGLGEQWWRQGLVDRADSVSQELYTTALRLARHRGLLEGDNLGPGRQSWLAEVEDVLNRVRQIAEMEKEATAER